jgi:uncharacterized protein (TIGR02246 family)
MKPVTRMALAVALAAAPALALSQPPPVPPELAKRVSEIEAAFNSHDAGKVAALFTTDGTFINPPGKRAFGREQVMERLREDFATVLKDAKFRTRLERARVVGDLALLDLEQEVAGPNLPPAAPRPAVAHVVALLQKNASGAWMVLDARPYFFLPGGTPARRGAPARAAPPPPRQP